MRTRELFKCIEYLIFNFFFFFFFYHYFRSDGGGCRRKQLLPHSQTSKSIYNRWNCNHVDPQSAGDYLQTNCPEKKNVFPSVACIERIAQILFIKITNFSHVRAGTHYATNNIRRTFRRSWSERVFLAFQFRTGSDNRGKSFAKRD
jgi:hypothetical protein